MPRANKKKDKTGRNLVIVRQRLAEVRRQARAGCVLAATTTTTANTTAPCSKKKEWMEVQVKQEGPMEDDIKIEIKEEEVSDFIFPDPLYQAGDTISEDDWDTRTPPSVEHSNEAAIMPHQDTRLEFQDPSPGQIFVEVAPTRRTVNWQEVFDCFVQVILRYGDKNTPQALDSFIKEPKSVRSSSELNSLLNHAIRIPLTSYII